MFLLSDVLNSYRDAGLKASVSILFDKNEFSNKIYLFSNTSELNQPSFNKIYNSIIDKTIDGNTNKFLVKSISSWVTSSLNFSVRMTKKQLSVELGNAPSVVTNLFGKLPKELFNLTIDHTLIEISCITPNQYSLVDLLLNDTYLSTQKFQLIYETNRSYRVIDVIEPTKKLEVIKKQKSLMDELIHKKLNDLNGSLSGIRHAYSKHNINCFLVCLLHGIKNIDEYEKTIKLDFFSKEKDPVESALLVDNRKSKPKISISKKLTSNTLIDDLSVPNECETIVERIRKFTPSPFNVEKLLKVEEYKFEWLQGITPEMIQSFKIFKAMLRDAVSGFSTNISLLKVTESVKKTLNEDDVYLRENISLKSKLTDIELSEPYSNIVNTVNKAKRTSMNIYELLSLDSNWFLRLYDISASSRHYSEFLSLREHLQDLLKSNHPKVYKSITSNLDKEPLLNVDDLKPNYICIGDWEDILTVASKAAPNDKNAQVKEINSQIQHFSDFRDTYLDGFNQEIIKAKETADWLFPGDFVKQLAHLDDEIKKLSPTVDSVEDTEADIIEIKTELPSTELDINSTGNIENVPSDVLAKIKEWAFEGYFDDKEMYDLFVQEQSEAYIALSKAKPETMPGWVWKSICDYTELKYVGDFSGQLREVKQHTESYFSIESIIRSENSDDLRGIKQSAREDLPGDYKGQLQSINTSLKNLDAEKYEENQQNSAQQEIKKLRPLDIRTWDWDETIEISLKECPNDPIGQLKVLKLQVNSFHDINALKKQGYENEVDNFKRSAQELFAGDYNKQLSYLEGEIESLSFKISGYEKSNQENLPSTEVIKETVNTVKSAVNREVKEINNSVVYDKNKSEKNFLSKLSSIFKSNSKPKEIAEDTGSIKEASIRNNIGLDKDKNIKDSVRTAVYRGRLPRTLDTDIKTKEVILNEQLVVEECHFVKFNKKNEIGIEVQTLKSFDAFEFESINNKLVVIINSNHPFYSKLYRNSSVESKRVIDMMISSLCHLSHLNISETVKQQDKKLFSRWSEYLEEYLLEE